MTDQQQPRPGVPLPSDEMVDAFYFDWYHSLPITESELRHAPGSNCRYYLAAHFAAWGANEQLRLCERWVEDHSCTSAAVSMGKDMRPEPPSPRELGLIALSNMECRMGRYTQRSFAAELKDIRRALEALSDD